MPFSIRLYRARPASSQSASFSLDVAGLDELPGKLIPIASIAEDIVLAVYIPPHEPGPGQAAHSIRVNSSSSICPLLSCPTPSKTDTRSSFLPSKFPGEIVPPYTKTAGTSERPMAIKQPGIFLSHPPIATKPSKLSAPTTVSIESAIKSRLGNEYRMPSVPIEIPSDTVIVLKINGTAPASLAPFFDASARSSIWILQGVTSLPVLAIPTIGFLKSSSSNPTALNIARFGAFAGPSLKTLLLILKSFVTTYPPLSCFIILQFFYFSIE